MVVIGAGAAGISAARSCKERGLSCIVLEAGNKIGGRASTVQFPDGPVFDLGAHWLHSPALNPLTRLVPSGPRAEAEPLANAYSEDGTLLGPAEVQRCDDLIEKCFADIARRGEDGLDEAAADSSTIEPACQIAFTNKVGVLPDRTSAIDFARYVWEGDDIPVREGMGALIVGLGAGLDTRLNSPVATIDLTRADRVRVSGTWGSVEARRAVVTASTGVLQSGAIRFIPELPSLHRDAIEGLPMGSCNKIRLSFTRRVFNDLPPSLLVPLDDPNEAMEIVLRENGEETAVGMFHGPFGRDLAAAGEAAMGDHLVATLAKLFGSEISRCLSPLRMSVNWDTEPFVRGYVAAALPGSADARMKLAEPIDGRLAFAGEATSKRFMGDVHGAWLEGEAAISRLWP
ncbi:MAG: NAD(P)/FAD-dependent oxidoreductase [Hyphomicrobiales bacterium]